MRPEKPSAGARRPSLWSNCNFSLLVSLSGEQGRAARPGREGLRPDDSSRSPHVRLNHCGTPTTTPNPASASAIQRDQGTITTAAITQEVASLRHTLPEFLSELITALYPFAAWFKYEARLNLLGGFKSTPLLVLRA